MRREGQWTLRETRRRRGLPEELRQLLVRRIEALPPAAQLVLEAASVGGEAFAAATGRRVPSARWRTSRPCVRGWRHSSTSSTTPG